METRVRYWDNHSNFFGNGNQGFSRPDGAADMREQQRALLEMGCELFLGYLNP